MCKVGEGAASDATYLTEKKIDKLAGNLFRFSDNA